MDLGVNKQGLGVAWDLACVLESPFSKTSGPTETLGLHQRSGVSGTLGTTGLRSLSSRQLSPRV